MTNFEDDDSAKIEFVMNLMYGKNSIANVIDLSERCHILIVLWSVGYNELKPLKVAREKGND
jgi:hypothetical protein